ncbi:MULTISPECIES: ABC transporter ATP-binding protein [unclassified Fusibacter]|uniref:ABC transporter ATP-binding protein n=1 Tax=unclassified Fusibacter TaxID=2624464 RepID=UPI0010122F9D|nr:MULTISPECIES: ABC transporter ATP-binding protein [unclassified Fusibacter]MCK8061468.1 ABC transporter ATP-binding protein/permease [Fusibacter sp. A2]NPE23653.1 ABC transporter ATP-binding protein [Fusibacter sp. A1]RXV58832.1 ABC transporter ATP-binding protein [Fusibacter sp. A1]
MKKSVDILKLSKIIKAPRWIGAAIILSLCTAYFAVQFPLAIQRITETINQSDRVGFYWSIGYAFLIVAMQGLSFYLLIKAQNIFVKKNMIACRNRLYHAVMSQPYETYMKNDPADYISMMLNDMRLLEDDFYHAILELAAKAIMFVFAVIQLVRLSPLFLLGLVAIGVIMLLIPLLIGPKISYNRKNQMDAMANHSKNLKEHFQGYLTIIQFKLSGLFLKRMEKSHKQLEESNYRFKTLIAKVNTLLMMTTVLLILTTFLIGGMLVLNDVLTIGALLAATQLIMYISEPLVSLSQASNQLKASVPILDKMTDLFNAKRVMFKTGLNNEKIHSIELKNMSFSFENNRELKVLDNINLILEYGKKYLLKGENGSGKSTFLNLIAGHLKPSHGWIGYFNHKEQLLESTPDIAVVSQNTYLFEGTIYDNVTLFADANRSRFMEACRTCGLDELLETFEEKEDFYILNNGENLSGGQRQKIAIARALYFDADILIFDEANSALDIESSELVEEAISALTDKLCIVVSHKTMCNQALFDEVIELSVSAS